jgi:hypothetical protein
MQNQLHLANVAASFPRARSQWGERGKVKREKQLLLLSQDREYISEGHWPEAKFRNSTLFIWIGPYKTLDFLWLVTYKLVIWNDPI